MGNPPGAGTSNNSRGLGPDLQIDVVKVFARLLRYWWLFAIFLIVSVGAGQVYLRYTTPLYVAKAKLMIKGVGRSGNLSETAILADGLGIEGQGKDMDNEIQILLSRPIITKTVERLHSNVTYYLHGSIKSTELYTESPIELESYQLAEDVRHLSFFVKVGYEGDFEFRTEADQGGPTHRLGQPFINKYGEFTVSKARENLNPGTYQINIMDPEDVAMAYKGKLVVEVVGAKLSSSILELKLTDPTPSKARDFIDTLIEVYNEEERSDATQVLRNTIEFIDERLAQLTMELNNVEGDIERFKSENEIITEDASTSLNFALVEMRSALAELSSYEVQQELLRSVENYLNTSEHSLIPTNIANVDPAIGSLIAEYNSVFLEQQKLLESVTAENQLISSSDARLDELKGLIQISLKNHLADLQIPISRTEREIAELKRNVASVPSIEQELLEKIRLQSIKEQLFLYLLTKKEETELSEAIATANTRIIESARASKAPVFPQRKLVLLATILLGLVLPGIVVAVLSLFQTTVTSEEMLKSLISIPIIARIPRVKKGASKLLQAKERSVMSEMFRFLRTNLNFLSANTGPQILLVTSCSPGEGKSFVATNLALSLEMAHKKVVILGFDMRIPKLAQYLNVDDTAGLSNFLSGQASIDEILHRYKDSTYLSYMLSGPIPPDPAELLLSDNLGVLFEELRKRFDYIVIDSPPIVVTDALLLRTHVSNTLVVVRQGQSQKSAIEALKERIEADELQRPSIVLNDIPFGKRVGSSYYTGSYGYYINEK